MDFNLDKGQHMLIDKEIVKKEISSAELSGKDNVIEIGAGKGILTNELAVHSGKVLAFEPDRKFQPYLDNVAKKNNNVKIIYGDALKYNWKEYNKLVSNIPYFIAGPLMLKLLEENIEYAILLVGEKFKNNLIEKENKTGVIASLFFNISELTFVDKSCFNPQPRVNSYLVKLVRKNSLNIQEKTLLKIITSKGKIKNALISSLMNLGGTKRQAKELVESLGIDKPILNKPTQKITKNFILRLKEKLKSLSL